MFSYFCSALTSARCLSELHSLEHSAFMILLRSASVGLNSRDGNLSSSSRSLFFALRSSCSLFFALWSFTSSSELPHLIRSSKCFTFLTIKMKRKVRISAIIYYIYIYIYIYYIYYIYYTHIVYGFPHVLLYYI